MVVNFCVLGSVFSKGSVDVQEELILYIYIYRCIFDWIYLTLLLYGSSLRKDSKDRGFNFLNASSWRRENYDSLKLVIIYRATRCSIPQN